MSVRPSCERPCLQCAPRGRTIRVVRVTGGDALARRLRAQGLWSGTPVQLLTTALGGDPLLFRVQGYRLALRRDEAARVLAEWSPDGSDDSPGVVD